MKTLSIATRGSLCAALLFMLTRCSDGNSKTTPEINGDVEFMSQYYGEPYDSLLKFIVFQDTTIVFNAGLVFSHFYDYRNTRRGVNDSFIFPLCKFGIFVKNISTGQRYIYSKNWPGSLMTHHMDTSNKLHYFPRDAHAQGTFVFDQHFLKLYSEDNFGLYRVQQKGVSMKLSAILNELPKKVKQTLTRKELDSIFQAFFFEPQQRSDSILNMLLENNDTGFFYGKLFYIDEISEYNPKALSTAKAYAQRLKKSLNKINYFIYIGGSRFASGWSLVIVINEDMVQDDITKPNKFFMEYDDEPMLYDIRIYSVY